MESKFLDFYSRRDIQKEIVFNSKDREVAVKFSDKGFGKRPDVLQFESDVLEFAKQGATSFHISEELWHNPLELEAGMTKKQLDEIRKGFDLILDIDCPDLEYSKITTYLLTEALKFHDIKNLSVKYSGNKGFHIAIPFKALPLSANNIQTRLLFPEAPRTIAEYLQDMIKEHLTAKILEKESPKEISKKINKKLGELIKEDKFNPFSIVSIDTVLISSRHMFRAPYSFHEKTGLISIPLDPKNVIRFNALEAEPEKVKTNIRFLDDSKIKDQEATNLFLQALDWKLKKKPEIQKIRKFNAPKNAVRSDFFPPCIKICLNGMKNDGRKRALFVLVNYLRNVGYSIDHVKSLIDKWNKKNYQPLNEGYIQGQISWHKRQKQAILPPNCPHVSSTQYYKEIGICHPDNMCKLIKNPVNYTTRKLRILNQTRK